MFAYNAGMAVTPETAPKCPQCQHPVTLNATTCPGCSQFFHEVCLRRGCACGGKVSGTANFLIAAEFAILLAGAGAAVKLRNPHVLFATLFWPSVALAGVCLLASLTRKVNDPEESANGHTAAQVLLIPVIAAAAVAFLGHEFPGFVATVVIGAVGMLLSIKAILTDAERANAGFAVLLAVNAYMVAALGLTPDFGMRAVGQIKAIAQGKASISTPLSQVPASTSSTPGAAATPALKVSGVMAMGKTRQALTSRGAFSVGQTIPDLGRVTAITETEVVVETSSGSERYPVPR